MKTVVALFEQLREAERAVRELIEHGIANDRIRLVSPAVGSVRRCTRLHLEDEPDRGAPAASEDLVSRLRKAGVPPADAERHALAIRQGGALVVVSASEHEVDSVAQILARHAPVDPVSRRRMSSMDAEESPSP